MFPFHAVWIGCAAHRPSKSSLEIRAATSIGKAHAHIYVDGLITNVPVKFC
ncbi:hypothetical protein [Chryseolinea lacunae]|uniref:Uncharacterized protein n=1 Tax=Chryseolinea lacunae TaxID=2801331 RepID=A0ABS1L025_9BACT|nr:hypothetical protein [Chryseolinea lacunae]MBL0745068.1 hypothetical protein [Chryseolinea lacunae]